MIVKWNFVWNTLMKGCLPQGCHQDKQNSLDFSQTTIQFHRPFRMARPNYLTCLWTSPIIKPCGKPDYGYFPDFTLTRSQFHWLFMMNPLDSKTLKTNWLPWLFETTLCYPWENVHYETLWQTQKHSLTFHWLRNRIYKLIQNSLIFTWEINCF